MQKSDEIKARHNHGLHELGQALHSLATITERIKTTVDEIHACDNLIDLADPTVDVLCHQISALTEEMNRVYALRNEEADLQMRQEISKLKRDIAALQNALRRETEEHRACRANSAKSNEESVQRLGNLERFNQMLMSRLNEMKEKYENAIIEVAELKEMNNTLQNIPAFNVITNTSASSGLNSGIAAGQMPFGRTVVETNRGLTVTIESSPAVSPGKTSMNYGRVPQSPSGAAFPFPDIAPQIPPMSTTPANGGVEQVDIHTPGRPKARGIVKGTPEANESFERMKRSIFLPSLADRTNVINPNNNATAALSSPLTGLGVASANPFGLSPETPSKGKSKLNPAVAAFTPSNSSGKDSANSGSVQASSPTKIESKSPVTATNTKEEGFISPHLRRHSKISMKDGPLTITQELPVQIQVKSHGNEASGAQGKSAEVAEPLQASSLSTRIPPHLRRPNSATKNENIHPASVQCTSKGKNKESPVDENKLLSHEPAFTGMKENPQAATISGTLVKPDPGLQAWLDSQEKAQSDKASSHELASKIYDSLIEIDNSGSFKAGERKPTPVPPGFTSVSANDAQPNPEATFPVNKEKATSPLASSNPITKNEESVAAHKVANKATLEEENNAAFLAEYISQINSVGQKYGRDPLQADEGDLVIPLDGRSPPYIPSKPTGTRELGALLDDECRKMVLKPRKTTTVPSAAEQGQEWKAVRKDGKIVYVL